MNKKIQKMQDRINKRFPDEDIIVLEANTCKDYLKIQCNNCKKIYEYMTAENAYSKKKKSCCHDCGTKLEKKRIFLNKIKEVYPYEELEVINFSNRENSCTIKCLKCGHEVTYQAAKYAIRTTTPYFCKKCHSNKQEQMQKKIQEFLNFINNHADWELMEFDFDNFQSHDLVKCKCTKCGKINQKTIYDYLRGRRCLCESRSRPITNEEFIKNLNNDYELVNFYSGIYNKIKIRHKNCGFIYETIARNVWINGGSCPKCSKKRSKGEEKIKKFLEEQNISFVQEYRVNIQDHKLIFDFYLPEINKFIEFNGIQHYQPVEYFGGEKRFKIQQEYDQRKKDFALNNLWIISYLDIDNIPDILSKLLSSTTNR